MFAVRRFSAVATCAVSSTLLFRDGTSHSFCTDSQKVSATTVDGVAVHFKNTAESHPLTDSEPTWTNPTQNYVWSKEEIEQVLSEQPKYVPDTFWDHTTYRMVRFSYWFFNLISGYSYENPTTDAIQLRVIVLESVAGIPGMVGAQHRHFRSLRTLERDYGWIHTLLEEAENERMHLLTFMQMFEPGFVVRALVTTAQFVVAIPYILLYITEPKAAHRFVGYLEETAVHTYCDIIDKMQTPGTHLSAWNDLEVPQIAKDYWMMGENAKMLDMIKVIAADETHHRDVNHTFACMEGDDPNPYVATHLSSAEKAWRLREGANVGSNMGKESWN